MGEYGDSNDDRVVARHIWHRNASTRVSAVSIRLLGYRSPRRRYPHLRYSTALTVLSRLSVSNDSSTRTRHPPSGTSEERLQAVPGDEAGGRVAVARADRSGAEGAMEGVGCGLRPQPNGRGGSAATQRAYFPHVFAGPRAERGGRVKSGSTACRPSAASSGLRCRGSRLP